MRARAFSYVFVRFRTVQYESNKISRFYALTPKITYFGRFSNCMVRCPRKVVGAYQGDWRGEGLQTATKLKPLRTIMYVEIYTAHDCHMTEIYCSSVSCFYGEFSSSLRFLQCIVPISPTSHQDRDAAVRLPRYRTGWFTNT